MASKTIEWTVAERKAEGWGRVITVTRSERYADQRANRAMSPVDSFAVRGSRTLCIVPADEQDDQHVAYSVPGVWNSRPWN